MHKYWEERPASRSWFVSFFSIFASLIPSLTLFESKTTFRLFHLTIMVGCYDGLIYQLPFYGRLQYGSGDVDRGSHHYSSCTACSFACLVKFNLLSCICRLHTRVRFHQQTVERSRLQESPLSFLGDVQGKTWGLLCTLWWPSSMTSCPKLRFLRYFSVVLEVE